jgi:hypothetical protein
MLFFVPFNFWVLTPLVCARALFPDTSAVPAGDSPAGRPPASFLFPCWEVGDNTSKATVPANAGRVQTRRSESRGHTPGGRSRTPGGGSSTCCDGRRAN